MFITYRDRPVELTIVGNIVTDELILECWDMSSDGGSWFSLCRDPDLGLVIRDGQRPIPVDLLQRVVVIAESELD